MKVGDLVRYTNENSGYPRQCDKSVGVIIRCISGTAQRKVVQWLYENGPVCSYPAECLEVVSATR